MESDQKLYSNTPNKGAFSGHEVRACGITRRTPKRNPHLTKIPTTPLCFVIFKIKHVKYNRASYFIFSYNFCDIKSVEGSSLEFVIVGVSLRCTTSNDASSYFLN